jgi:hypothetical protein
MPALSELHAPGKPLDLSPCVIQRLVSVDAQWRLFATAGYFSCSYSSKNGRDSPFCIDKCPAEPDESRMMSVASRNTGLSQSLGDTGSFPVC